MAVPLAPGDIRFELVTLQPVFLSVPGSVVKLAYVGQVIHCNIRGLFDVYVAIFFTSARWDIKPLHIGHTR